MDIFGTRCMLISKISDSICAAVISVNLEDDQALITLRNKCIGRTKSEKLRGGKVSSLAL